MVVGTVEAVGQRWSAVSVYGPKAWAVSQERARQWVRREAKKYERVQPVESVEVAHA
jgi:hypothetical protein